jgi:hypothetical protein
VPAPPPPAAAAPSAAASPRARANLHAQRFEFLAQCLAIVPLRAGHHQTREHSGRRIQAFERLGIAVVQSQHERDRRAAVLLGQ